MNPLIEQKARLFPLKPSGLIHALLLFAMVSLACSAALCLPTLRAPELEHAIASQLEKVEEFRFIRETARELGIRVWLFGGTASSYAHYVRWDLLRKKGDRRFQADRFDFDFTNIFRSTQDLDIVADGTLEQIDELQGKLAARYPEFVGSKARWEVRSLTHSRGTPGQPGYKEALLGDYDFLNQNTDSNSTGMVELSKPAGDEPIVRDLRDWKAQESRFFKDILSGSIHFYRSSTHLTTSRYKLDQNPEIFSVIRALTKAFQNELRISPQDRAQMLDVIQSFEPSEVKKSAALARLKEIGVKLIKHAVNIEYAWNTLEELGLRKKLMSLDDVDQVDSLAWWMNKEPLKSRELGKPVEGRQPGLSAGEIFKENGWVDPVTGKLTVAHETNSFSAYESITRAHTGDPNVLISRSGVPSETASLGDGFYAQAGKEGARGTGLTIRFTVDPRAREGVDFVLKGNYLIFTNKKALRVIPESLNLNVLQYFEFLRSGGFDKSNLAIVEKLKRRLKRETFTQSLDQAKALAGMVERAIDDALEGRLAPEALQILLKEYRNLPRNPAYPDFMAELLGRRAGQLTDFVELSLNKAVAGKLEPAALQNLLQVYGDIPQRSNPRDNLNRILEKNSERWTMALRERNDPLLDTAFARIVSNALMVLDDARWVEWVVEKTLESDALEKIPRIGRSILIENGLLEKLLANRRFREHPLWAQWMQSLIETGKYRTLLAACLQREGPSRSQWTHLVQTMIDGNDEGAQEVAKHILSKEALYHHPLWPVWVRQIIDKGQIVSTAFLIVYVLGETFTWSNPEWRGWMGEAMAGTIMRGATSMDFMIKGWLKKPIARTFPQWTSWMDAALKTGNFYTWLTDDFFVQAEVMANPHWAQWIDTLVLDAYSHASVIREVLGNSRVIQHPRWPQWMETTLRFNNSPFIHSAKPMNEHVLNNPLASRHPEILRATKGEPPTAEKLGDAIRAGFKFESCKWLETM